MWLARGLIRLSAISVSAHIKMEMVAVRCVVVGAENGSETLAGAVMDSGQELHFPAAALPIILDRYSPSVGKHESRHVDRIGMRMLRQFARSGDIAAAVTAHRFNSLEIATEIFTCRALHRIFGPRGKFAGQFAFDRAEIGDVCSDIEQLDAVNLAAPAAKLAVGQGRETDIGLAEIAEAAEAWGRCD
jgi:hypothetical protein